ncbi:MAG TPA: hypothetical protein VGK77_17715 [Candidatus Binatia bacterium]|jgi:hypothetical protein
MSFGKQTAKSPAATDNKLAPAPPKRAKNPWLHVGIVAIMVATMDLIYIGGTGTSLIELESESKPDPTFHAVMSVVLLIFGIIALVIHLSKRTG